MEKEHSLLFCSAPSRDMWNRLCTNQTIINAMNDFDDGNDGGIVLIGLFSSGTGSAKRSGAGDGGVYLDATLDATLDAILDATLDVTRTSARVSSCPLQTGTRIRCSHGRRRLMISDSLHIYRRSGNRPDSPSPFGLLPLCSFRCTQFPAEWQQDLSD